jgi:uncharacterized protein (DUF1800 family)
MSIVTLFIALCLMLTSALTAQAAQNANNTPRRMRNVHRTEATAVDADPLDATDARFLLTRTGFEANAAEVALTIGMTREQAVDALLAGARTEASAPPPVWVTEPVPSVEARRAWTQDERRDDQREQRRRYDDLRGWWIREMLTTRSPLTERMTLFWHDHFPSGEDKVHYPQLMFRQNALLRRDALGNFGDLLHAVSKDPAMLQYLDGAGSRKGRPNENFAREVMELFTLGEGHYSQRDVAEAARAYTGWTLDPNTLAYQFNPKIHDDGDKNVLGQMRFSTSSWRNRKRRPSSRPDCGVNSSPRHRTRLRSRRSPNVFARRITTSRLRCGDCFYRRRSGMSATAACWSSRPRNSWLAPCASSI